jgi:hypothetical protein
MLSLRSYARCIGLAAPFSTRGNFFGYVAAPPRPAFTGAVSLRTQMSRLDAQHFHLAIILVGFEEDGSSLFWDATKEATVDAAVHVARDIYARAGFGIGRITRWRAAPNATPTPHNMLLLEIWGGSSGVGLVEKHNVDRSVINAFIVPDMDEGLAGHNPHGEHGVIVKYNRSASAMGRTLAHELGHILISSIGWI